MNQFTRCTIVPPHLLESVATGSNAALRDIARRTLALSSGTRTERRMSPIAPAGTAVDFVPNRTIADARNGEELPGETVRSEGGPATGDAIVDQAYTWLGATFDFFEAAYQRNSIDAQGLPLLSTVHYGREYDNAFWNGQQMVYGDGDGELFNSFTEPLDVTGHELVHGLTQHTANLDYYGQAGALNESVSDVFGVMVKQWHLGQTADAADWLIGVGLFTDNVNGKALRSMKEPGTAYDDPELGKDPQPGHMDDYVETYRDNGGVHINSGIPNRAFYLAATAIGGNAWEKTGKVWYETLTGGKLSATADFASFAAETVAVASALFGPDAPETAAVRQGWSGVGVHT